MYNGANYLAEALDSILSQTYTDFELVISDNASTDETPGICESYAARDSRVRYFRNSENVGAARNYNLVYEYSTGEFFKWAAHDDTIEPRFLEKCVDALTDDDSAVLAYTRVKIIDGKAEPVGTYDVKLSTDSLSTGKRFRDLLIGHRCYEIFGLIRSTALGKTPLIGSYSHGDGVLLARLGLLGRFVEIPEYLFCTREHPQQSMNVYGVFEDGMPDYQNYAVWFDPAKAGKITMPYWTMFANFHDAVWKAPLGIQERLYCLYCVAEWTIRMRGWLKKDAIAAASHAFGKLP